MSHNQFAPHPTDTLYASPRIVTSLTDCWFYHTIDLPGYGCIEGQWDLRAGIDAYLGSVPLRGKRALDLGTASGFVCFHMERQGAEVVAFDLSEEYAHQRNIVPFAGRDWRADIANSEPFIRQLNNSYWLSHHALNSSARVAYGSIYAVPKAIGMVDLALFGCILLHLRDPFLALANTAHLVRETIIVADAIPLDLMPPLPTRLDAMPAPASSGWRHYLQRAARKLLENPFLQLDNKVRQYAEQLREYAAAMESLPVMLFRPDYRRGAPTETWWYVPPALVCEFLGVLGFEKTQVTYHTQFFGGAPARLYTVVGTRTKEAIKTALES